MADNDAPWTEGGESGKAQYSGPRNYVVSFREYAERVRAENARATDAQINAGFEKLQADLGRTHTGGVPPTVDQYGNYVWGGSGASGPER